ncbi:lysine-2,3-aminomutase-like protein [Paracoccus sp. MBLB3053]|uniref:Lysine-2,3-aminomutase-like protein n=1 Tax=Paracoccus aurantius TaxID=3073814 RepID=A0ABU2HQZ0_9RHOB|nr:lysine-2,3-aminomutase-like protein [Paracoccus sp. MBLB3053]MDS9467474.1 lysine-2,3-aminomutase-like protein [Paracoccus sp. MBLB3053]
MTKQIRPLTTVSALTEAGLAAPEDRAALEQVAREFRIRVTPAMHEAMQGAGDDPVARQFVPDARELTIRPEELEDPISDEAFSPTPGLTHRYPDRVILHITRTCEVYCRFCFRREVVGEDGTLPEAELSAALDYIARTPAIHEVILTGGDPMVLSARRIAAVIRRLEAIPHLDLIRFHTRIPVVAPHRIDEAMLEALQSQRLAIWVVLHTNHAQELTPGACAALRRLSVAGIPLLSQTVLLKGVNADPDTLTDLFRALLRNRVKPYYLHHCDLARGTSHFRTTIAEGQAIMDALRGRLSGTCLPTYVLDLPGGYGKVPLGAGHVDEVAEGRYRIRDWRGAVHDYRDLDRTVATSGDPHLPD